MPKYFALSVFAKSNISKMALCAACLFMVFSPVAQVHGGVVKKHSDLKTKQIRKHDEPSGEIASFEKYGRERAAEDIAENRLYSTYSWGWALLANTKHEHELKELIPKAFSQSGQWQQRYLDAFERGYTAELFWHGFPPILPQVPLINKLSHSILIAAAHNGHFPIISDQKKLLEILNDNLDPRDWLSDRADLNRTDLNRYRYNSALAGKTMMDVKEPDHTLMLYEVEPDKDGRRWVAFVDGNTRDFTAEEWQLLKP